jgi:hypothetical protein
MKMWVKIWCFHQKVGANVKKKDSAKYSALESCLSYILFFLNFSYYKNVFASLVWSKVEQQWLWHYRHLDLQPKPKHENKCHFLLQFKKEIKLH